MILLEGKPVAQTIAEDLKQKISSLASVPSLVIIQVGDNPSSTTYINRKIHFGKKIGVPVQVYKFEESITTETIFEAIQVFNQDPQIGGIIIQLPLPSHINKSILLNAIKPEKDVDGLSYINAGKLFQNDSTGKIPATPRGVISLLKFYNIPLEGQNIVVIGRSKLVGLPLSILLSHHNTTVNITHSYTKNLSHFTKSADILISAIGKPHHITREFIHPGSTVVDIGTTAIDGKLYGDVDFDNVRDIVYAISPVPGGVGPMTVASLFQNLLD